jgi:hypothetical protein
MPRDAAVRDAVLVPGAARCGGDAGGVLRAADVGNGGAEQVTMPAAAAVMSEEELMTRVGRLCRDLRLLAYHTHDSRKSPPGYPDWHIVGHGKSIFRECKTEHGRITKDQDQWISRLREAGYDVEVWRPRDWFDGRIQRELVTISRIELRSKSA